MSFEISPSIPVNGLYGTYENPGGILMSMNANYFPNTDIPLQGPIFWKRMIDETKESKEIIELYLFQLIPVGKYSNIWYQELKNAVNRGVKISCVYSASNDADDKKESAKFIEELTNMGCDMARFDATKIFSPLTTNFSGKDNIFYNETKVYGPTIREVNSQIHVKSFIFDRKTFYIGSANTDYAAAREFGIWITDITFTNEIRKQFQLNYDLAKSGSDIIDFAKKNLNIDITHDNANELLYNNENWPEKYNTKYNSKNPYNTILKNKTMNSIDFDTESEVNMYLSVSPMSLCPKGWEWDYLAWMNVINSATTMLYIANFDFSPTAFGPNLSYDNSNEGYVCTELASQKNWPFCPFMVAIENAVERGVQVRLIGGSGFPHKNRDYLVPWGSIVNQKANDNNWKGNISISYWPVENYQKNPVKMKAWPTFPESKRQPSQCLKDDNTDWVGKVTCLKDDNTDWVWKVTGGTLHEKFAVSDNHVLISTNNLSSGYFSTTTGMSIVIQTTGQLRDEVQNWFNACWYGPYSGINKAKFEYNNTLCDTYSCPEKDTLIGYSNEQADTGICTASKSIINKNTPYRIEQKEWVSKPIFCMIQDCKNNPCNPYKCTEGEECISECSNDNDCVTDYICSNSKCIENKQQTCENNPCNPYKCTEGEECISECSNDNDCVSDYICSKSKCTIKHRKFNILLLLIPFIFILLTILIIYIVRRKML